MGTNLSSRTQRLRTLENRIRKNYESFVQTGQCLKEIRDDRLYEEHGFGTWEGYLSKRVALEFGIEKTQARNLIQCAQIRQKLPDLKSHQRVGDSDAWTQRAVQEFARLVPDSKQGTAKKDYSALRKSDASRVAKRAIEFAGDATLTSSHVRKAVDEDLGIDRQDKAKQTRREREAPPKLEDYLESKVGVLEGITERLTVVPARTWELLEESNPQLAERLATGCDELAELLRS